MKLGLYFFNKKNLINKIKKINKYIFNYFNLNEKERPNYLDDLNNLYSDESIYLLNYPKNKDIFVSYGKLLNINNSDIRHNCNIKKGTSGSPILLINNQKLIGIHFDSSKQYKYNKGGLLIYSIIEFSKIKKSLLIINKEGKNIIHQQLLDNCIIGELDIKEDKQVIRIINSYEESNRENKYFYNKEYEKEIKENCIIRINDEFIPFTYHYKFNKKGKYTILYIFKNNITNTNSMFSECSSLTILNLSYFNANNITDMSGMFRGCSSLKL